MATLWHWKMGNILRLIYDNNIDNNYLRGTRHTQECTIQFYNSPVEIELHTYDDIVNYPNDTFYIILVHGISLERLYRDDSPCPPYSDELYKALIKHRNLNVIYLNEYECDNPNVLQFMDEKLKSLDLHPSQFYIVNNNYLLKKYKEEFETNLNVHSIDRLSHVYSRELSSYSHPFLIDREFTFMTHIRQVKIHRYGLLMVLKKKGFLDVVDYSLLKNDIFLRDYAFNSADRTQLNPFFYAPIFSDSDLEFFKDEIKFLIEHPIKKSKHEEKIDFDRLNDFDYNMTFENGGYINSYINIVTETLFVEKENIVHITDKSYIPFYFTQIPIFLSTHHHVKSMREKYDLDFFDDLIDHSYDNEEDCQLRFLGVMKQIEKLYYQRDNMKIFFKENKNRLLRNKEIIIDIVNDNKDGRFFANLKREYNG